MDLIITKQLYYNLLLAREELRDEVFRLLASVVLREPLGHDMVCLLPVLHHLLEVLLTLIRKIDNVTEKCPALTTTDLHHQHVDHSDISNTSVLSELSPRNQSKVILASISQSDSPESILALVNIPREREVLAHEGDVAVPGLVEAQHPQLGVPGVRGEERLDLPGHDGCP